MKDQTSTIVTTAEGESGLTPVTQELPPVAGDKRWRIFLTWATDDIREKREAMQVMLQKAGMEVYGLEERPENEADFKKLVDEYIAKSDCTLHIMGGEYGPTLKENARISLARYQYERALLKSKSTQGAFKRIVWNFPLEGLILQGEQQEFIINIQNNISSEVMVSAVTSAAQFIDDIRAFLEREAAVKVPPKEYDIAFIANVQDAGDCYEMIEKLSEELKLTTLTVVPENDINYRQLASEQIRKSRLAVVYFKEASDWAVSFVKQLWKYVGGASSSIPFLLIGEDEPRRNRFLHFKAPQTLLIVAKRDEVLGLVRQEYDKVRRTGNITEERFSPYTGLRPFNEDESIFFKGRDKHVDYIIDMLQSQKFAMVTGSSGDGKSSLLFAGVIPNLKGGFLRTQFSKWAVADFRPERQPLRNLALTLATELRQRNPDDVENALSYGFSALVDLYKKSPIYCDMSSQEWIDADEDERKAMKRKAANLLILVDQFEELFTNIENYRDGVASPTAQIMVNVLVETIRIAREENLPIYVVCTMRSDYIGQCVAFRGFAEMIGISTYYVPRLRREEVQEVIEGPSMLNGDKLSNRLSQRLVNDLGDGIDQLPVLQHSLHQIWTSADEGRKELDLVHYAEVGGLAANKLPAEDQNEFNRWFATIGETRQSLYDKPRLRNVLNRHSNELYETASEYYNARYSPKISNEQAKEIIRTVFVCLTKIDDNRAVRNRMTLQQITDIHGREDADAQTIGRVVNLFREQGNTFVQPYITDDPETKELNPNSVLDITHESLIRNWERLTDWAESEDKSVRTYSDFKIAVNRWLNNDCEPKFLLGKGDYEIYQKWYTQQQPNPAWIRRYIRPEEIIPELDPLEQAANYLEDIDEFLGESRRRINRNKRLQRFAIFILIAFICALAVAAYLAKLSADAANVERVKAEAQTKIALEQTEKAKQQERLAAIARAEAERNAEKAKQAAIQAEIERLKAEEQTKLALSSEAEAKRQAQLAKLEKDKAESARREADENAKLAQLRSEEAQYQTKLAVQAGQNALIQKNNALILQSLFLSKLSKDEADAGHAEVGMLLSLKALPTNQNVPADSLSRPYVDNAEASLYYSVSKIVNASPKSEMQGHTNKIIFNQFSPDSKKLITTSWDKTARLWDIASGRQLQKLTGHANIVEKGYFSQDGRYVVTSANDFSARIWDFKNGRQVASFRGHSNGVTCAEISPNADKVVTGSSDNTGIIWNAKTGDKIAQLVGHTDALTTAIFSPDGARVATTSKDGTARLWNSTTGALIAEMRGHGAAVNYATFSHDGQMLATVSDDHTARIWNGNTGALITVMKGHHGPVQWVDFSFDNKQIATASDDSTAGVWDIATAQEIAILKGHTKGVYHIAFSSDDKHLVSTSDDGTVRLWDAISYLGLAEYKGSPIQGYHAVFSPDAQLLAVAAKVEPNQYLVRIYEVFPNKQELTDYALTLKKRDLTDAELKQFFLADKRVQKEIEAVARDRNERLERKEKGSSEPTPASPSAKPAMNLYTKPANGTEAPNTYRIKEGDTFWSIAKQKGVKVDDLQKVNGFAPNQMLKPGMLIKIPN